jgi:hypothetical protein
MCFGYCKFGENPVLLGSVHVLPGFVHGSSACQLRIQLLLGAAIKERNNVCFCLHLPCTLFSWQVCVSSVLSKSSSKTCFFLFGAAQLERDVFRCFMRISRFAPLEGNKVCAKKEIKFPFASCCQVCMRRMCYTFHVHIAASLWKRIVSLYLLPSLVRMWCAEFPK